MADSDFDDDDYIEGDGDGYCIDCGGEGWRVTCIDDICHGLGYCIHGDGMAMCHCNDGCDPPSNAPADWRWTPEETDDCASPFHPGCSRCEVKPGTQR